MAELHVVTDRAWMRDELARNAVLPVVGHFGYELPHHSAGDSWWIPQGIATRFVLNGLPFQPQAPGAAWLPSVPRRYSGREVENFTAGGPGPADTWARDTPVFLKFAEAKVDWFPADLTTLAEAEVLLRQHAVPAAAVLQVAQPLELGNEYRCFVRGGSVVASSIYLLRTAAGIDYTYYDLLDDPAIRPPAGEAEAAVTFLQAALPALRGPGAYVIDVAFTVAGEPLILEANPAWCSAWYGCDIDEVVRTIAVACRLDDAGQWRWQPDAILRERYAVMRPLLRA